jgi:hypothetical protein
MPADHGRIPTAAMSSALGLQRLGREPTEQELREHLGVREH